MKLYQCMYNVALVVGKQHKQGDNSRLSNSPYGKLYSHANQLSIFKYGSCLPKRVHCFFCLKKSTACFSRELVPKQGPRKIRQLPAKWRDWPWEPTNHSATTIPYHEYRMWVWAINHASHEHLAGRQRPVPRASHVECRGAWGIKNVGRPNAEYL